MTDTFDRTRRDFLTVATAGGAVATLGMLGAGPALAGVMAYVLDQLLSNSIQYTALVVSVTLLLLVIFVPRGLVKKRPTWREPHAVHGQRTVSGERDSFRVLDVRRAFGGVAPPVHPVVPDQPP